MPLIRPYQAVSNSMAARVAPRASMARPVMRVRSFAGITRHSISQANRPAVKAGSPILTLDWMKKWMMAMKAAG